MAFTTKPRYFKRFVVIRVMSLCFAFQIAFFAYRIRIKSPSFNGLIHKPVCAVFQFVMIFPICSSTSTFAEFLMSAIFLRRKLITTV